MTKTRDMALIGLGASLAPRARTEHHSHRTEVHEHRAPTDKSVKLLMEMEEKAREKILATIPLKSNEFEGALVVELDGLNMEYVLTVRAAVNGKHVEAQVREYADVDKREAIKTALPRLRDALAAKLATDILFESFDNSVLRDHIPR